MVRHVCRHEGCTRAQMRGGKKPNMCRAHGGGFWCIPCENHCREPKLAQRYSAEAWKRYGMRLRMNPKKQLKTTQYFGGRVVVQQPEPEMCRSCQSERIESLKDEFDMCLFKWRRWPFKHCWHKRVYGGEPGLCFAHGGGRRCKKCNERQRRANSDYCGSCGTAVAKETGESRVQP